MSNNLLTTNNIINTEEQNMTTHTNSLNEQLFTDLTPEKASMIQGGATKVTFNNLVIKKLTSDEFPGGGDEPFIRMNGDVIWKAKGVKPNDRRPINVTRPIAKAQIWEDDGFDDFIGELGFSTSSPKGTRTAVRKGSGAVYEINFTVS